MRGDVVLVKSLWCRFCVTERVVVVVVMERGCVGGWCKEGEGGGGWLGWCVH